MLVIRNGAYTALQYRIPRGVPIDISESVTRDQLEHGESQVHLLSLGKSGSTHPIIGPFSQYLCLMRQIWHFDKHNHSTQQRPFQK